MEPGSGDAFEFLDVARMKLSDPPEGGVRVVARPFGNRHRRKADRHGKVKGPVRASVPLVRKLRLVVDRFSGAILDDEHRVEERTRKVDDLALP